jgi:hypothetical protein
MESAREKQQQLKAYRPMRDTTGTSGRDGCSPESLRGKWYLIGYRKGREQARGYNSVGYGPSWW